MVAALNSDERSVLQMFGRHLVALCVTFRDVNKPDELPHFHAYAGTLIALGGKVFFLTAGHILKGLHDGIESNQVMILNAVLADNFGTGRHNMPIPFELKSAPMFFIDDDEEGLDFGVIALRPYYLPLLAANNTVAIQEENWVHQHKLKFTMHFMLGLPEEFTSKAIDAAGVGLCSPTLLPVTKLETPPVTAPTTRNPEFIGQLKENFGLESVVGMSGGPIFGFIDEPPMRYWIVALQSSWLPESRTTFGCSFPVLASLMTEWAKSAQ